MRTPHRRGFTLIELLLVVSLIGLLASIILTSLTNARAKARDAQRIGNLKQIANAISLYADQNTSMSGCASLHSDILTCTGPFTVSNIKDPTYVDSTHPGACGTNPSGVCQFSISKPNGTIGAPATQNWVVCTYLESGTGQPLSISSATSTPFSTNACP